MHPPAPQQLRVRASSINRCTSCYCRQREGDGEGDAEGNSVGLLLGEAEGVAEGEVKGLLEGKAEGLLELDDGLKEGDADGAALGGEKKEGQEKSGRTMYHTRFSTRQRVRKAHLPCANTPRPMFRYRMLPAAAVKFFRFASHGSSSQGATQRAESDVMPSGGLRPLGVRGSALLSHYLTTNKELRLTLIVPSIYTY